MEYIYKIPNGEQFKIPLANLVARLENGVINANWPARPENSDDWVTIAEVLASAPITDAAVNMVECPKCGSENPWYRTYCEKCKINIEDAISQKKRKEQPLSTTDSLLEICQNCKHQFSKRALSCPKCQQERTLPCFVCRKKIPKSSKYCPECGDPAPFAEEVIKDKKTNDRSASTSYFPKQNKEQSLPAQSMKGNISKLSIFLLGTAFSTFGTTISTAYRKTHILRYDYSTVEEYARAHGINAGLSAVIGFAIGIAISIGIDKSTMNKTNRLIAKWVAFILGFLVYGLMFNAVGG